MLDQSPIVVFVWMHRSKAAYMYVLDSINSDVQMTSNEMLLLYRRSFIMWHTRALHSIAMWGSGAKQKQNGCPAIKLMDFMRNPRPPLVCICIRPRATVSQIGFYGSLQVSMVYSRPTPNAVLSIELCYPDTHIIMKHWLHKPTMSASGNSLGRCFPQINERCLIDKSTTSTFIRGVLLAAEQEPCICVFGSGTKSASYCLSR